MILRIPDASVFIYTIPGDCNVAKSASKIFGQISKNEFGKPILPAGAGFVSWSHSRGQCLLAYSKECEVGIDLEFYKERNFEAISKRFFSQNEFAMNAEFFYSTWTKKEAYYKCFGGDFFSFLKTDSYIGAKFWNLQGPYEEKHEAVLCVKLK